MTHNALRHSQAIGHGLGHSHVRCFRIQHRFACVVPSGGTRQILTSASTLPSSEGRFTRFILVRKHPTFSYVHNPSITRQEYRTYSSICGSDSILAGQESLASRPNPRPSSASRNSISGIGRIGPSFYHSISRLNKFSTARRSCFTHPPLRSLRGVHGSTSLQNSGSEVQDSLRDATRSPANLGEHSVISSPQTLALETVNDNATTEPEDTEEGVPLQPYARHPRYRKIYQLIEELQAAHPAAGSRQVALEMAKTRIHHFMRSALPYSKKVPSDAHDVLDLWKYLHELQQISNQGSASPLGVATEAPAGPWMKLIVLANRIDNGSAPRLASNQPKSIPAARASLGFDAANSVRSSSSETVPHIAPDHDSTSLGKARPHGDIFSHGSLKPTKANIRWLERKPDEPPVPKLAYGLDRVLFNPAPYILRDPNSHVFNFSPDLQTIPPLEDFDFNRLSPFKSSSQHEELHAMAQTHQRDFVGSTSSLTGLLSHIYFLISRDRPVNTETFSAAFANSPRDFTPAARMPASVKMHFREGVHAIDSDENDPDQQDAMILLKLGTVLEHFLTLPRVEFNRLQHSSKLPAPEIIGHAYQYSLADNLVMRSQLDCQDPRLPGTGVFDLKTRAAIAIRRDLSNHKENSGYVIRKFTGELESFEREHYDLLRSGLLEYSFQARIGNMDGIFIAFHNTEQIFGFQYMPVKEMDVGLFGSPDVGDRIFQQCVGLLTKILGAIKQMFPVQTCKVMFDNASDHSGLRVWIEPEGEGPPQVTELIITVRHFHQRRIHNHPKFDADWTMEYHIKRNLPSSVTKARRDEALRRQQSVGQVKSTKTTSVDGSLPKTSATSKSSARSPFIANLRRVSQLGRLYTAELARRKRIMWSSRKK